MSEITGWYYLHENNELIFKHKHYPVEDIRESSFAIALWPFIGDDRESVWNILVESLCHGARPSRIKELAGKWGCDDDDAKIYAERVGAALVKDGDQWCATGQDFENLQESPAGFGESALEAMAALARELGLKPSKMWSATFRDVLNRKSKPPG